MSTPAAQVDDDIQAAFAGPAPAPTASPPVDDDVAAAFAVTPTGQKLPASPDQVVAQVVRQKASQIPAAIGGGLRSIYDLATGKTIAETDKRYQQFVKEHSFQPTDPKAKELSAVYDRAASSPANPMTWPGRAADIVAENATAPLPGFPDTRSPETVPVLSGIIQGATGLAGLRAGAPASISAEDALAAAARNSPQSQGAAAAAANLAKASPELKASISAAAQKTGGAVNPEALNRHLEADSLPVKIQLTPGQALQNPATISQEMNRRGATPGLPELLRDQNSRLGENLQTIRDQVGPDVFSTNQAEHGDTLIGAYKDHDAKVVSQIDANYKAAREANAGSLEMDGNGFVDEARAALKPQGKSRFLPPEVQGILDDVKDRGGQMSLDDFEGYRTQLSNAARKAQRAGDGNAEFAIGQVRNALENAKPVGETAANAKALFDVARQSAKARFDALRADPAYNAAVNDLVAPDDFVGKYVIRGKRDNLATMRQTLADNPTASQTISVAALDHLRNQSMGANGFNSAGYSRALKGLEVNRNSLFDPKTNETLDTLGNVARYTQSQPRGSYVNNSNTLTGAIAEHAATGLEVAANAKTVIGGTLARKALQNRAAKKQAEKVLTPYGGMDQLPNSTQGK